MRHGLAWTSKHIAGISRWLKQVRTSAITCPTWNWRGSRLVKWWLLARVRREDRTVFNSLRPIVSMPGSSWLKCAGRSIAGRPVGRPAANHLPARASRARIARAAARASHSIGPEKRQVRRRNLRNGAGICKIPSHRTRVVWLRKLGIWLMAGPGIAAWMPQRTWIAL